MAARKTPADPKATAAPRKKRTNAAPRVSAKSVRLALIAHGGNISAVKEAFGVSRQTVYNWVERYKLRDEVELSRDTMFATAEANINLAVQAGNLDASKFVLTHMPVNERWSSRSELTGKDGTPLMIDAELREAMKKLGIDESQVVAEFREIMLAAAAAQVTPHE